MDFLAICGCIAPAIYYIIKSIVLLTTKDDPAKSGNDEQPRGNSRTTKWRKQKTGRN